MDLWLDVAHQVNEGVDDLLLVGGHRGLHPVNLLLRVDLDAVGNVAWKERGEFLITKREGRIRNTGYCYFLKPV